MSSPLLDLNILFYQCLTICKLLQQHCMLTFLAILCLGFIWAHAQKSSLPYPRGFRTVFCWYRPSFRLSYWVRPCARFPLRSITHLNHWHSLPALKQEPGESTDTGGHCQSSDGLHSNLKSVSFLSYWKLLEITGMILLSIQYSIDPANLLSLALLLIL